MVWSILPENEAIEIKFRTEKFEKKLFENEWLNIKNDSCVIFHSKIRERN